MKIIIFTLLILTVNVYAETISTTITNVHDGDSVRFNYNNTNVPGRLVGIDAPELKQSFGIESRDYLRSLILNKKVEINIESHKDLYDRYLVTIYLGLENINRLMIENGFAWNYFDGGKYKIYKNIAQKQSIGLWSEPNPITPSSFRKMGRKEYYVKLQDHDILECRTASFKTCGEFEKCSDAMFWFEFCGHSYLDRNDNDIPCETICK
jgi:endonuclease YncB( thermonuclease family)